MNQANVWPRTSRSFRLSHNAVLLTPSIVEFPRDDGVTRAFLPHGLGQGQCFTIEPGVYFIEPLFGPLRQGPEAAGVDWKLLGELRGFGGVRIEDDLIVVGGDQVARNLTRKCLA